jgi:uncharacterized protein
LIEFDWDDANIEHLRRHDAAPAEFEQAMLHDPEDLHYDSVEGEDRFHSVGVTNGGRLLFMSWTVRSEKIRGDGIRAPPSVRSERKKGQ